MSSDQDSSTTAGQFTGLQCRQEEPQFGVRHACGTGAEAGVEIVEHQQPAVATRPGKDCIDETLTASPLQDRRRGARPHRAD
jgi:hypothetical protein